MEQNERDIALDFIDEPAAAMRTDIGRDEVFELAQDIKKNGLINPITVRPRGERFEVVAGHRRFLAHRYGGIPKIRCVVRDLTDDEAFAIMTSENLKRENVNPVDEATHVRRLMDMHGNNISKVCDIVNRGREWVESRMTIARMPDVLREALRTEKIKLGVALALVEIDNDVDLRGCLDMAISQGASVVVANYWVAQYKAGLFGHALEKHLPDSDMPDGQRTVVMLRCAVDGKEHPASEMRSILVHGGNVGYVEALRTHLSSRPDDSDSDVHADLVTAGVEA